MRVGLKDDLIHLAAELDLEMPTNPVKADFIEALDTPRAMRLTKLKPYPN